MNSEWQSLVINTYPLHRSVFSKIKEDTYITSSVLRTTTENKFSRREREKEKQPTQRQYPSEKMISEILNSLFLTYLASEYLVAEEPRIEQRRQNSNRLKTLLKKRTVPLAVLVLVVNILETYLWTINTGVSAFLHSSIIQQLIHLPKAIFAAIAYVIGLYLDIRYNHKQHLSTKTYLKKVGIAFCKVLPAYPILAVLISFVFLFVINIFEALNLPLELLNMPIYYGTLYGPFAWVYVYVKRQVCDSATSLPTY